MQKTALKILTLSSALLLTPEVLALDMDYYAPNGMPVVADAFKRMALIFSDSDYNTAFTVVAILGLLIATLNSFLIKPLTVGLGKESTVSWFGPFLIGAVIYTALFIPKATLHVYDPVRNDTQSVAGIPQSIVVVAGLVNMLERAMIDITDTASSYPYSTNADGINLELFLNAIQKSNSSPDKYYLDKDLQEFKKECGNLVMTLPGNTNEATLQSGATSLYNIVTEWNHDGITVGLHNGSARKTIMTCTEGLKNVIKPSLATANFEDEVQTLCKLSGFDTTGPQLISCKNLMSQASELHGITGMNATDYVREAFIAGSLLKEINSGNYQQAQVDLIGRQLALKGIGSLNAANSTQPQLRAVMTSVILGLIPFLTLFLVTPLWSKALKFMTGALLWITTWGIMTAVAHAGVMDSVIAALSDVANSKMGIKAFTLAQTDGVKAMMIYGEMQSNALMMATAVAVGVYGFGSYAMTGMAQSMTGGMQRMGEQAAQQTMTPEGRAQLRNQLTSGMASDGGVASQVQTIPNQSPTISNTGSNSQMTNAANRVGSEIGTATATTNAMTQTGNSSQGVGEVQGETNTNTAIAGSIATKQTQANLGDGNTFDGATKQAEFKAGQEQAQITQAEAIANIKGNNATLREGGMNQVYGQGQQTTMTGSQIMDNKEMFNAMKPGAQNAISSNPEQTYQTHLWTNNDGEMAGFRIGNQESVNLDKSFNNQDNESINKRDTLQTGSSIMSGDTSTKDDSVNIKQGLYQTDKSVTDTRDQKLSGSETTSGDRTTVDNTTSSLSGKTYVDKTTVDTQDQYQGGVALDGRMVDVGFDNANSTERMAVNKVNQDATKQGIDSQSAKSLESAMVHNWEARGVSMSESISDSSSVGSSQKGGLNINSKDNIIGGIVNKFTGAGGYAQFEASASQDTRDSEEQRFNSFNSVARGFIAAANGDTEKLAQMSNAFETAMVNKADEQVDQIGNTANSEAQKLTDDKPNNESNIKNNKNYGDYDPWKNI